MGPKVLSGSHKVGRAQPKTSSRPRSTMANYNAPERVNPKQSMSYDGEPVRRERLAGKSRRSISISGVDSPRYLAYSERGGPILCQKCACTIRSHQISWEKRRRRGASLECSPSAYRYPARLRKSAVRASRRPFFGLWLSDSQRRRV